MKRIIHYPVKYGCTNEKKGTVECKSNKPQNHPYVITKYAIDKTKKPLRQSPDIQIAVQAPKTKADRGSHVGNNQALKFPNLNVHNSITIWLHIYPTKTN